MQAGFGKTGSRGMTCSMREPARQALLLLGIAAAAAAASWALRDPRLPLRADSAFYELELAAPLVEAAEALRLYEAGDHLFIDTRPVAPGTTATIPASMLVRAASFDDDLLAVFDFLRPEDPLVLFGDGDLNGVSNVAARLRDRGFQDLTILRGGLDAWRRAGGECTEPRPADGAEGEP